MGSTEIPEDLFNGYLLELNQDHFRPEKYNLFSHNCNTFSNEAAQFLTGRTIPRTIQDLPQEVLKTPFGAMIKPMFDSMSVRPHSTNVTSLANASNQHNPDSIFEPRPESHSTECSFIEGPKTHLEQSKDIPVIYNDYKVSNLVANLETTIEKDRLGEQEIQQVKEIEDVLKSDSEDCVTKDHLQLLESLLERYESSEENVILTNIIQTLGLLVLKNDIIFSVCQDPVSKPVFKLARDFSSFKSTNLQCAVVELLTNICSTDVGRGIFVSEEEPEEQSESTSRSRSCTVDHRDVIQVAVKTVLSDQTCLCEKAAALVYNISMAKVSEESALECSSALLECLRNNVFDNETVYRYLFALRNFMKISPEVVNLTNVIGIDLLKFNKLTKDIENICSELQQYLVV